MQAPKTVSPRRPLTRTEQDELRKTIASANWKQASSPQYRNAPHCYIIALRNEGAGSAAKLGDWQRFADLIRECGVHRTWRGRRYKYLLVDGDVFWTDWPVLNRAKADTLDGKGRNGER